MPSIKDLRKRIASVKNTQQTTRALKMVSAAKLRRAQDAILNHRPYAKRVGDLIDLASSISDVTEISPLIRRASAGEAGDQKNVLLVLVTSDRGLCAAFNSNVIKSAQRWIQANQKDYAKIQLSFVGRKGYDFFKTKKVDLGTYFQELGGKVSFAKSLKLADALIEKYLSGGFDEIKIIYNEFKNAVAQQVQVEDFLPLQPAGSGQVPEPAPSAASSVPPDVYIVKPNQAELLDRLLAKNFAIQAFRILLESQAGEHGARMSAMENATKNAGEMIRKLTLLYNKQRQAGITKELLEIISGSESQKSTA